MVSIGKLNTRSIESAIVVRLMMACNDLVAANVALGRCREACNGEPHSGEHGALMYFVRLQIGHLNEYFSILQEVRDNTMLADLVGACGLDKHLGELAEYGHGGRQAKTFLRYVEMVRHKTAFHYDDKMVKRAIAYRAISSREYPHKITVADNISSARFQVADDIVNTIVGRQLWNVPVGDTTARVDEIAGVVINLFKSAVQFGGRISEEYIRRFASS